MKKYGEIANLKYYFHTFSPSKKNIKAGFEL